MAVGAAAAVVVSSVLMSRETTVLRQGVVADVAAETGGVTLCVDGGGAFQFFLLDPTKPPGISAQHLDEHYRRQEPIAVTARRDAQNAWYAVDIRDAGRPAPAEC